MNKIRLTTAQAVIKFLKNQFVERDGKRHKFFEGIFGIFGHGNVAGIGQALQQNPDFKYYQTRNEQAMVHTAAAFAKMNNRLKTFVCTSSIGPGATNMITAAAGATINRLPVLLIPGDIFSRRNVAPVLQQLEIPGSQDISVNDCFKPISKYWDRINRPEQIITSLPEIMRVLTSPSETGAVTLAFPQDVQAETFDYPEEFFNERTWYIPRTKPDSELLKKAVEMIKGCKFPLIIAGGGVIYGEATESLKAFSKRTGIAVAETQAGKGALSFDNPLSLGAVGVTGTRGANIIARDCDLVIGIGTRYTDFTTASKTAFQNLDVKFININVAEFDAFKHSGLPLTSDAKATIEELDNQLKDFSVSERYHTLITHFNKEWNEEVNRIYHSNHGVPVSQGEVIGVVNEISGSKDVLVCAAGSLPGDLHKLWRTRDPKGYHLEYGYSCMGYEIAGGLGVKMAAPEREVYVMVGDGSYLMLSNEIVTSIQEKYKLTIILINNDGFASIGGLSKSIGSGGFGTRYKYRNDETGQLDGNFLPVNFAENAKSLGAFVMECSDLKSLEVALKDAKNQQKTTVIVIKTDYDERVPGYESWWDVAVAGKSEIAEVNEAYKEYIENKNKEKYFLP